MQTIITVDILYIDNETFFNCIFTSGNVSFIIEDRGDIIEQLYILINDKCLHLKNNTAVAYNPYEGYICYPYGTMTSYILFNKNNLEYLKHIINFISKKKIKMIDNIFSNSYTFS